MNKFFSLALIGGGSVAYGKDCTFAISNTEGIKNQECVTQCQNGNQEFVDANCEWAPFVINSKGVPIFLTGEGPDAGPTAGATAGATSGAAQGCFGTWVHGYDPEVPNVGTFSEPISDITYPEKCMQLCQNDAQDCEHWIWNWANQTCFFKNKEQVTKAVETTITLDGTFESPQPDTPQFCNSEIPTSCASHHYDCLMCQADQYVCVFGQNAYITGPQYCSADRINSCGYIPTPEPTSTPTESSDPATDTSSSETTSATSSESSSPATTSSESSSPTTTSSESSSPATTTTSSSSTTTTPTSSISTTTTKPSSTTTPILTTTTGASSNTIPIVMGVCGGTALLAAAGWGVMHFMGAASAAAPVSEAVQIGVTSTQEGVNNEAFVEFDGNDFI